MDIRRRLVFLARIVGAAMPRLNAVLPSIMPLAIAGAGILGAAVVSKLTEADSPWPFWIGLTGIALAVLDAAYLEWNHWAPYGRPKLVIEAWDWPGYAGLKVTNNDIGGRFKAVITGVNGPTGLLPWGPDDLWPWPMAWADDQAAERDIERHESVKLRVVLFNPNAPLSFEFLGPTRQYRLPAFPDRAPPQTDIEIHIRFFRISPAPAHLDYTARVSWPRGFAK